MTKNTGIRIETLKEVDSNGKKGYRITKIQALSANDLPKLYTDNGPAAILGAGWSNPDNRLYLINNGMSCCFNGYEYIWPRFYTTADMEKINAHVAAAGQHLTDVNRKLAKKRKVWNVRVVFVDGVEVSEKPKAKPESVPERISRLWVAGNLFFRTEEGFIESFPKPEVEKRP